MFNTDELDFICGCDNRDGFQAPMVGLFVGRPSTVIYYPSISSSKLTDYYYNTQGNEGYYVPPFYYVVGTSRANAGTNGRYAGINGIGADRNVDMQSGVVSSL